LFKKIKSFNNHIIINAKHSAKDLGNSKVANMILLGAASSLIPISEEAFFQAINHYFKDKSEKIKAMNIEAFKTGQQMAKDFTEFVY